MNIRLIDVDKSIIDDRFIEEVEKFVNDLFDKNYEDITLYIENDKVLEVYMESYSGCDRCPAVWYNKDWFLKKGLTYPL